jgi:hypothetical protein
MQKVRQQYLGEACEALSNVAGPKPRKQHELERCHTLVIAHAVVLFIIIAKVVAKANATTAAAAATDFTNVKHTAAAAAAAATARQTAAPATITTISARINDMGDELAIHVTPQQPPTQL